MPRRSSLKAIKEAAFPFLISRAYFITLPHNLTTFHTVSIGLFSPLPIGRDFQYLETEKVASLFVRAIVIASPDREKQVPEASSIHIDLGFSAPYFDLPLLRSGIPSKSLTPRIQWDFTPGKSFTLPPLIKTLECSCEL